MADTDRSKRIAKNTAMLYIRLLVIMAVGLYTSRVVLEQLGVNDYGIYNVVGGVVTMFSIVSSSLSGAISRFLSFEMGKGHGERLKKIFSTALFIQIVLGVAVCLLIEVAGVWFVENKMQIAPDRLDAAYWVLQCSMLTFFINMLSVPYNGAIIAHERMQAFAYISLLEAGLKLGVAFLLFTKWFDSLKMYAVLLMLTALAIRWVYALYCNRHFEECRFGMDFDRGLMKQMLSFSGWNFIGSSSAILRDSGVNILLNMFCGTAVNAARGIAVQLGTVVANFSNSFLMAVNPQVIKSYAGGDRDYMLRLVYQSSKFGYFLIFLISLPLLVETRALLGLWLTVVPDHAVSFVRLMLMLSMADAISIPLQFVNQANGRVKVYQLTVGSLQMLNFPVSYVLLYFGAPPESTVTAAVMISIICLGARLLILRHTISFPIRAFLKRAIVPVLAVTLLSVPLPMWLSMLEMPKWVGLIACCGGCVVCSLAAVWCVGLGKADRRLVIEKLGAVIAKIRGRS